MKTYGSRSKVKRTVSNPTSTAKKRALRRRSISEPAGFLLQSSSDNVVGSPKNNLLSRFDFDPFASIADEDPYSEIPEEKPATSKKAEVTDGKRSPDGILSSTEGARHEDRAKLDEIEYLLDGLGSNQPDNVRRSSGCQLAKTLKNGDVSLQVRSYMGFEKIFSKFASVNQDPILAYTCGVIGCLVTEDSKNKAAELSMSFLTAMESLYNLDEGAVKVSTSAQEQPARKRRRRSAKKKRKATNAISKVDILSILDWDGLEQMDLKKVPPTTIALRAMSRATVDTAFKELMVTGYTELVRSIMDMFPKALQACSEGGGHGCVMARKTIEYIIATLENLTHEDSFDPKFIYNVGPEGMEKFINSLCTALEEYLMGRSKMGTKNFLATLRILVNLSNNHEAPNRLMVPLVSKVYRLVVANTMRDDDVENELFDVATLGLGILINSCEKYPENCEELCKSGECKGAVNYLSKLFHHSMEFSGLDTSQKRTPGAEDEDSDSKMLEARALASYSAMLLGFLARSSKDILRAVRLQMKKPNFSDLVFVLKDFIVLQCKAGMATEESLKSLILIVDFLNKNDDVD